jgi:hypothetical protein
MTLTTLFQKSEGFWDLILYYWANSCDILKNCSAFMFKVKQSKKNDHTLGEGVCRGMSDDSSDWPMAREGGSGREI